MYKAFEKWLNGVLEENMPIPGVALNFNLYEEADFCWSIQLFFHPRKFIWMLILCHGVSWNFNFLSLIKNLQISIDKSSCNCFVFF